MVERIEANGGKVRTGVHVAKINVGDDNAITSLDLSDGTSVTADYYVSAVPVDVFKKLVPKTWKQLPFFEQIKALQGVRSEL